MKDKSARCIVVIDPSDGNLAGEFSAKIASWAQARGISALIINASDARRENAREMSGVASHIGHLKGEMLKGYLATPSGFGLVECRHEIDRNALTTISHSYDFLIISLSATTFPLILQSIPDAPALLIANSAENASLSKMSALQRRLLEVPNAPRPIAFALIGGDNHIGAKLSARLRIPFWGTGEDIEGIACRVLDSAWRIKEFAEEKTFEAREPVQEYSPHVRLEEKDGGFDAIALEVVGALRNDAEFKDMRTDSREEKARAALIKKIQAAARRLIASMDQSKFANADIEALVKRVVEDSVGLGPLEALMADSEVTEIMVNNFDRVYVERSGAVSKTSFKFSGRDHLMAVIERMVASSGRRIDESSPMVDARLPDGSRLNVIIPPVSIDGPLVTIRKFMPRMRRVEDIVASGMITKEAADFLCACVNAKISIVVSGGTGTGKTTLLNVLASAIGEDERVVTIEDAAELRLTASHVVRLEARPANIEGAGAISIRDLVKNALRMRPDRIVVGECRGPEALDMLMAMNTGHEGSLTTVHANSPRDAIARLETMVLMAGIDLPLASVREQIVRAVDIIVQLTRSKGGSRKVSHIIELSGMEGGTPSMQTIAEINPAGSLVPTGLVPRFAEKLKEKGLGAPVFGAHNICNFSIS